MIEIDAYLGRINYRGAITPTLGTLRGLLQAHMQAIPFENLDVLLGRPISLALDDVEKKLVRDRRGGYCFEHVTLFAAVLETLGFDVVRHLARVLLFAARRESPRTHMFLVVNLPEGPFIADPGFGGPAAPFPVPLVEGDSRSTHWMTRADGAWVLNTPAGEAWTSTLDEVFPIDFVVSNHFTATHPSSIFIDNLLMSRFTETGRVTVMNRDVTVRTGDTATSYQLADHAALRALLQDQFGFDLPEAATLRVPDFSR